MRARVSAEIRLGKAIASKTQTCNVQTLCWKAVVSPITTSSRCSPCPLAKASSRMSSRGPVGEVPASESRPERRR
eukprot:9473944-Pyramimonas_sp.AAC.1